MSGHFTGTGDEAQVRREPQAFYPVALIEPFLYVTAVCCAAQRLEFYDRLKRTV